ncbi:MAG: imidazolonepropionase [Chloroflexi bacterium]|uniref:Imidazolonepropionase n=1 Tax=Candidatus Chlorohelix allophototropha TaxID=3003348 RepID=A0A8T7M650_9CHLR|nr:imidazolonepropionase [Chloroflexota bacterium]WJW69438.1 imidazolonepropionase [Chloroflexota bacterium L227-S17]
MQADLIIYNAGQLVTCASQHAPKRGAAMREVGKIADGAVAIKNGQILAVGASPEILGQYDSTDKYDAGGRVVCPGFVDAHTHAVYAGERVDEFDMRIAGKTYLEIMQAGGGINSTMRKTRAASPEQLYKESLARLQTMLMLGTTTAEVKTGYGLDTDSELKMLRVIEELDRTQPIELIPTFLGAHSIPPEFAGRANEYIELVIAQMLPAVANWYAQSSFKAHGKPCFVDIFCEQGAFSAEQTRQLLEASAKLGFKLKAHVDEFVPLGGTSIAIELGATSIDHLDFTHANEIAKLANSETVAVVIPAVNFNLGSNHFANAHEIINQGAALALATDINPGSAPCPSIPLVMAIACRYQRLLPSEALNAVTINAAYASGMGERIGSIEVGKQADLLVLDVSDYRHLAYQFGVNLVKHIFKKGKRLNG